MKRSSQLTLTLLLLVNAFALAQFAFPHDPGVTGANPAEAESGRLPGAAVHTGLGRAPAPLLPISAIQDAAALTGVDWCAKVHAAIAALPSTGGIVDARNLTGTQSCASDPFAGEPKPALILMGGRVTLSLSVQIRPKTGQVLQGTTSGSYTSSSATTVIRPTSNFPAREVILFDPANEGPRGYQIVGNGMRDIMIDMTDVAASHKIAIQLNSVSNSGPWSNITVLNQDNGSYLKISKSANPGAGPTDGITFYDFYTRSMSASPVTRDPGVIIEGANEISFLGARTKIQRAASGTTNWAGSVGVHITSVRGSPANAITLDGISVAGYETDIKVDDGGEPVAPRWVRIHDVTIETYNVGILVDSTVTAPQSIMIGPGNRYITPRGSSPTTISLQRCSNNTVIEDENAAGGIVLGTGSSANTVFAQPIGITDKGANNVIVGRVKNTLAVKTGSKTDAIGNGSLVLNDGSSLGGGVLNLLGDTPIARIGAGQVRLSGSSTPLWRMQPSSASPNSAVFDIGVNGEGNVRFLLRQNGGMSWGAGGAAAPDTNLYRSDAATLKTDTRFVANAGLQAMKTAVRSLPACSPGNEGLMTPVTDSNTAVWGSTIAGGGANHVLAYCDGSQWTVAAK